MTLKTLQAKSAKHLKRLGCFSVATAFPRRCGVSSESRMGHRYASHDETPARCKRRALSAAFGLEAERHQNVGVLARDRELVASRRPREDRVSAADHIFNQAGFKVVAGERTQLVTHVGFRRCGFSFGQVGDQADVANEFHRYALRPRREPATISFHEPAFVPTLHVAKDGRIQSRVRRLAARAFPQSIFEHRGNHLLGVHRFSRFAQDLQRCVDTRKLLLGSRRRSRVLLLWDSFASTRLIRRRFGCRGTAGRSAQPAGRLDPNLLSGREIRRVPAAAAVLGVDPDRDLFVGDLREVLATDLYVCLFHLRLSVWVSFVVGCHRQAAGTTRDNARLRFGFRPCVSNRDSIRGVCLSAGVLEDRPQNALVELSQQFAKDVVLFEHRAGRSAVVEVGDLEGFGQSSEVVRDGVVRLANLLGLVRVHVAEEWAKGVSAGGSGFVHRHVSISGKKVCLPLSFGVNTHEPCVCKQLKPILAVILSLFQCLQGSPALAFVRRRNMSAWFAEWLRMNATRANVGRGPTRNGRVGGRGRGVADRKLFARRPDEVFQFLEPLADVLQRPDVFPIDRMFVVGGRHVLDRLVHVFEQGQRTDVCGGVCVFDSLAVFCVGHGGDSGLSLGKNRFGDTHEPCGAESIKRSSENVLNVFRTSFLGRPLTVAAGFPGPLAAVANLPAFDDVDHRVFGDVLVVDVFARVVFARFVHLRAAGHAGDAVFKGPVLLRHQTHFGFVTVLFAEVFEQLDQLGNGHVCVSIGVNEKPFRMSTHEPWNPKHSKRISEAILSLFECFSNSRTWPDVAACVAMRNSRPLLVTYAVDATRCTRAGKECKKRRGANRGVACGEGRRPLDRLVVFAGQVDKLLFDRFPIAGLFADRKLAESFVAEVALVPTLRPTQPVEEPVEFRFTVAGVRSVPARFGAGFLCVVPSAAALRIEGEFYQSQNHLDVADQFRFVERAGEGPNLDPIPAGCQVRQVEKVVAISFAACLRRVFVAVRFDLFRPLVSFAAFGSGRSVDGAFVVSDQRDQAGQGRGVAVPRNRDVKPARFVDPRAAFFDRVDRGFYVSESFVAAKDRRYKFAWLASGRCADTSVAFCFPTRGQPGNRQAVVVSADRRGVGSGHVGFDFDAEGDVVGVHGWVSERRVNSFVECTWSHAFRNTSSEVRQ